MRPWAKLDVGYMTNPKTYALRNAISNASGIASSNAGSNAGACALALCMHVSSILYASQHRTDGHVPIELMKALNQGGDEQVDALAEVGMWHLTGHACPDCPSVSPGQAYVHDYLDHNSSAKDASKASEKARKAAHARWNALSNASSNADRMPKEKRREEKKQQSDSSDEEPRPEIIDLLDHLDSRLKANGLKKPNRTDQNIRAARLLLDKDGRTAEQVKAAIDFAQNDEFWIANVRSMSKLRDKYDQLQAKAQSQTKKATGTGTRFGEVDPEAVLGKDLWQLPEPPGWISSDEYAEWAKSTTEAHRQERIRKAKEVSGRRAG